MKVLQTIYTERIKSGDVLLTDAREGTLRRRVKHVSTSDRVYLTCADGTSPIYPKGRLVKVERTAPKAVA